LTTVTPPTLIEHFAELDDPRMTGKCRHKLLDMLVIAVSGIICQAEDWATIAEFGRAKEPWFRTFLELPNGIPSHDTFGRVFARIDPERFAVCFSRWMQSLSDTLGGVVAIDGKTLRGSYDRDDQRAAIHMVSAWAVANGVVLGQVKTEEKSNEITAIPDLLELLSLQGCLVTTDAMGCQREIARRVVEKGGDYLLAVKDNQPKLHAAVLEAFEQAEAAGTLATYTTADKGHGRRERRHYATLPLPESFDKAIRSRWASLTTLAVVEAERTLDGKTGSAFRYFISSASLSAERFADAARGHWGIENNLHWVLDVRLREDESRVRKGHGAQNLSRLRHMALNVLKADKTTKLGVKNKRLKACWDERYLATLLLAT
jgi:predicted transposase YbfD/YdcC